MPDAPTSIVAKKKTGPRIHNVRDVPTWLASLSVIVAALVIVAVQWRSTGPVFRADEVGNLGNALLLANPATSWLLTGNAYMPGFSIFLTPIWWFTDSPDVAYRAAVILGAAISVAAVVPLSKIARHFGAPSRVSVIIGAIIVAAPSRALEANYVWAENLLVLLVCFTVALLLDLDPKVAPKLSSSLLLGLSAGGTFLAHGRALPFALLALVGAGWLLRRHVVHALVVLGSGFTVMLIAYGLLDYISDTLYIRDDRIGKALGALSDTTASGWLDAAASQLWYQVAAWLGLSVLGGLVLVNVARKRGSNSPEAVLTAILALLALTVPLLTSDLERSPFRLDLNLYGRYLDAFLVPLVACALAAVWLGVSRRIRLVSVGVVVASGVLFALVAIPNLPIGASVTPAHFAGIAHFVDPTRAGTGTQDSWFLIALLGTAGAIVALLLTVRPMLLFVVLGMWAVTTTLYSDNRVFDPQDTSYRQSSAQLEPIRGVPEVTPLHADSQSDRAFIYGNEFTFWSTPRPYVYVDLNGDTAAVDLLIADLDSDWPLGQGGRPVAGSIVDGTAIWVFPGAIYDQLDQQNLVMQQRTD